MTPEEETPQKACPFDKKPCIKEACMAWSCKENLSDLERDHKDSFEALLELTARQEGVSLKDARGIIEIRNNNERCKLIDPEQPI